MVTPPAAPYRRRWWHWLIGALLSLIVLIAGLPYLIGETTWGKRLLLGLIDDPRLQIDYDRLALGWTSPLAVEKVRLANQIGEPMLDVDRIVASVPWWRLVISRPTEIDLTIDRPHIPLILKPDGTNFQLQPAGTSDGSAAARAPSSTGRAAPTLHIHIRNATVTVTEPPQPTETLIPSLSMDLHLEQTGTARTLTIDPVRVLDRAVATPAMCRSGLQFVAPVLTKAAWVNGEVSLALEQCRLNLDDPRQSQVQGQLSLHHITVGPQGPIVVAITDALSALAKQAQVTQIKIADESVVPFQLADGQVSHSGLAFGLPEVAPELVLKTSGSVSLDRQLNLLLEAPLPFALLQNSPLAQALGNQQLRIPVRGTLDDPKFSIEGDGSIASGVISELTDPEKLSALLEAMGQARQERIERREQRRQDQPDGGPAGGLRGRLGDRLRGRLERGKQEP
ncbi:MAG: hypothetical protein U0795_04465 [Pirellulales bacterium]